MNINRIHLAQIALFTVLCIVTASVSAESREASDQRFFIPSGKVEIEAELVLPDGNGKSYGAVVFNGGGRLQRPPVARESIRQSAMVFSNTFSK